MTERDLCRRYPSGGFECEASARRFVSQLEKLGKYHGTVFWVENRAGRYVVVQGLACEAP